MNILLINVTGNDSMVAFCEDGKIVKKEIWKSSRVSGDILEKTKKVLGKNIPDKIGVVTGPGGFTQSRIGVVMANALGQIWKIKIVGMEGLFTLEEVLEKTLEEEGTELVKPYYLYEPHITKPKKI